MKNNKGYASLIMLLLIVAAMAVYMTKMVSENKKYQDQAIEDNSSDDPDTFNPNDPVTRENAIGKALEVTNMIEQRNSLILE